MARVGVLILLQNKLPDYNCNPIAVLVKRSFISYITSLVITNNDCRIESFRKQFRLSVSFYPTCIDYVFGTYKKVVAITFDKNNIEISIFPGNKSFHLSNTNDPILHSLDLYKIMYM